MSPDMDESGAGAGPGGYWEEVDDPGESEAEQAAAPPAGAPGERGVEVAFALEEAVPPAEGEKLSVVEALLYVSPEPLSVGRMVELTGIDQGAVREIVNRLIEFYEDRGGGLLVREVAGGFGFYATPEAAPYISRLIRSQVNPRLTRAALETLAIVAYLQPVSRGLVAEIRGVQSEGVMRTLEERGLVKAVGKGGPPGYPVLYATTTRFLERFGLKSTGDLPPLESFAPDEATVEKIRRSLSWEIMEEGIVTGSKAGEGPEDAGEIGGGLPEGVGGADSLGEGDPEREDGEDW